MKFQTQMETGKKHLLVFRFSAMGDVALTVPVIRNVLHENKNLNITLVTNPLFTPFFYGIERLTIFPADFKGQYRGLKGLYQLYKDLKSVNKFDYLIDLHNVIRSRILSFFFLFSRLKGYRIYKNRKEKKKVITGKLKKPLIHTTERYKTVFENIIKISIPPTTPSIFPSKKALIAAENFVREEHIPEKQWIGIAPMAKHELKKWPIENIHSLIKLINKDADVHFFLFGGGKKEKEEMDKISIKNANTSNITGKLNLSEEIALISKMNFMITMDSANMHISSLLGVPTISIWGGTHTMIGFGALHQPEEYAIQVSAQDLTCRPCTVYGKGTCKRGDLACFTRLSPEIVYRKLIQLNLFK